MTTSEEIAADIERRTAEKSEGPRGAGEVPSISEVLHELAQEDALQKGATVAIQSDANGNVTFKPQATASTDNTNGGVGGSGAVVPNIHLAATRAQAAAENMAEPLGCGVITITYDAAGAYRICSKGINLTYVIGFLQRSILSLQSSAAERPPFAL
jgi:hypothetical protein